MRNLSKLVLTRTAPNYSAILPFGTEEDVRASVQRLGRAILSGKRTGMIAQCSWETVTPLAQHDSGV